MATLLFNCANLSSATSVPTKLWAPKAAMNATRLYVSAAQLVLTATTDSASACFTGAGSSQIADLNRLLPLLRQVISCAVCCRLLNDPYATRDTRCSHNVCRLCVRGRKALRPACVACRDSQDFRTYDENRQMRLLLLCYKSLCEHLMASPLFAQLSKQRQSVPPAITTAGPCIPLPQMSAQEFVLEGASFEDVLSSFSVDLPRGISALPVPAPMNVAATPSLPAAGVLMMPKAATSSPATCVNASLFTPSLPPASLPFSDAATSSPPVQVQTQQLTLKHLRSIVDLTGAVQFPAALTTTTSATACAPSLPASVSATPSISYMNTAASASTPSFVLPATIVTQSTVAAGMHMTSAPLTIASAKLQSLSRQLVQARAAAAAAASAAAASSSTGVSSSSSSATTSSTVADVSHHQQHTPPLTFKVSLAPSVSSSSAPAVYSSFSTSAAATATTTATVTSQQIRNPPPIKTVSNGSAMYSVLYTGIGNKITIKRKTDGDEDAAQRKNASTSAPPPAVFRQMSKLPNPKRRGCRCGNATPTPGKLTCCGQRCPCYVDSKSCIGCKCRGCRNPHRPDGGKVRPVIPELACYEIQMADESSSLSPHELLTTSTTTSQQLHMATGGTPATIASTTTSFGESLAAAPSPSMQEEFVVTQQSSSSNNSFTPPQLSLAPTSSSSNTTTTATLIPFRNLQQIAAAHSQQQQQQQQQHTQTFSTHQQQHQQPASNTLQLENLQRESVLIQNAEGKYQVVNVFTTGPHNQNTNQISGLQRLHTISQLQAASSSSNSNNSNNNNMPTVGNTYQLLPTTTATVASSTAASTCTTPTITQLIMQQHHQQQQQQQHHQHHQTSNTTHIQRIASSTSISSSTNSTIPLQLQQQLKQNNIITVHPISANSSHHHQHHHQHHSAQTTQPLQTMPLISSSMTPTTITLSPIIVSSSGGGAPSLASFTAPPPDMFSDSSDEFISLSNSAAAAAANVIAVSSASSSSNSHIVHMPPRSSPFTLLNGGGSGGIGIARDSVDTTTTMAHFAPAMVEVIESNDL